MTTAERAAAHIVNRVITSLDFRWHMLHTEARELLPEAESRNLLLGTGLYDLDADLHAEENRL